MDYSDHLFPTFGDMSWQTMDISDDDLLWASFGDICFRTELEQSDDLWIGFSFVISCESSSGKLDRNEDNME